MPMIRANSSRVFHRTLYGGLLVKIRLLKRGDDQQQGTVKAIVLYQCRKSSEEKTGESIQGDMSADHRTIWFIPRIELDRVGVNYLNSADRIVELEGRGAGHYWQPEATTSIAERSFMNQIEVSCLRVDPPK